MSYIEQAQEIIQQADISDGAKKVWTSSISNYDESVAKEFMGLIDGDKDALRLATEVLQARFSGEEAPQTGIVTKAEQKLLHELMLSEENLKTA